MSVFGRLVGSIAQMLQRMTRRVEVAVGLVLVFFGIVALREVGDILSGAQQVSGGSPTAAVVLLLVAAAVSIGFGVRFIHSGF